MKNIKIFIFLTSFMISTTYAGPIHFLFLKKSPKVADIYELVLKSVLAYGKDNCENLDGSACVNIPDESYFRNLKDVKEHEEKIKKTPTDFFFVVDVTGLEEELSIHLTKKEASERSRKPASIVTCSMAQSFLKGIKAIESNLFQLITWEKGAYKISPLLTGKNLKKFEGEVGRKICSSFMGSDLADFIEQAKIEASKSDHGQIIIITGANHQRENFMRDQVESGGRAEVINLEDFVSYFPSFLRSLQ